LPVLGLVGGIGAGKSTVAAELARRGWHVLDADKIGHALLDQKPAREAVVAHFGPSILVTENGERIDRKALAQVVFADHEARRALERVLHPRMRATFEKAIERVIRRHGARGVVLDAAILFEAGWDELCDLVAFVDAPQALRVERLRRSRGWTGETLAAREKAQLPLKTKRARSDVVVDNGGAEEDVAGEVDRLIAAVKLRERALRSARNSQGSSARPVHGHDAAKRLTPDARRKKSKPDPRRTGPQSQGSRARRRRVSDQHPAVGSVSGPAAVGAHESSLRSRQREPNEPEL
jgi:dephospho-CoA kinase